MMLGTSFSSSSIISNNNNSATGEAQGSGGDGEFGGCVAGGAISGGGFSDEDKGVGGARIEGGGGNRWPRQETLALLQIRSEMGLIFRDSNLKVPLWEEVSRKMGQLGYERSGKKCKEKFENVYKYHKRTKDNRAAKADGKSYRFFQELEALESSPSSAPPISSPPPPSPPIATVAASAPAVLGGTPIISPPPFFSNPTMWSANPHLPLSNTLPSTSQLMSDSLSSSSTSSGDNDHKHQRKRKMRDFFDTLMKDVIAKQEELQKRFLETLEKRERDRMIREEAWRVQEMARMNRELDLLAQERSKAAAKDLAMMAFLQKMTGQQSPPQTPPNNNINLAPPSPPHHQVQISFPELVSPPPPPPPRPLLHSVSAPLPPPPAPSLSTPTLYRKSLDTLALVPARNDNVGEISSSRWPKAEVEALISLRTNIDMKYLDNNPKGPLWEEISAGMSKMGYNRSSKRCKEKWENINKYFKKVKESNKKRPEDSKTCPYFHQLDAIYREKSKTDPSSCSTTTPTYMITEKQPMSENKTAIPLMVRPEQEWPLLHQESAGDHESDNMDENDNDDDDDDDGDGYEIVTNKQTTTSMTVATTAPEEEAPTAITKD